MGAITRIWTAISDAILQGGKPVDTTLLTAKRDNVEFLMQWLGASYLAGAVQDHNHDGVNSAAIQIGSNAVRNGSFEDGLSGWTATQYSGGTVASSTTGHMDGQKCAAITSTSITTGGGDIVSDEYIAVTGGELRLFLLAFKGSVAGIASKAEVIWYDEAKAQVSASQIYATAATPTTRRLCVRRIAAPAAARYCRVKLIGGTPTLGSATGTVYFDGVRMGDPATLGGEQVFTASGTFSAIWGDVHVEVQGGGANGQAWTGSGTGIGGSAGGYAAGWIVTSEDVAVAVGGVATVGGGAPQASTFLGVTANGGATSGGVGGTASGGTINIAGQAGQYGNGGSPQYGGHGGSSRYGQGGFGAVAAVESGKNGTGYGTGGGGGNDSLPPGTGTGGIVVVRW